MKKYLYFVCFVFLLASSCAIDDEIAIDPCQDEFVGSYDLLATSDDVFPYLDFPIGTNIIFVNESGDEIVYTIDASVAFSSLSWIPKPCPSNETDEINYEYESGSKIMTLISLDNPVTFNLNLRVSLDYNDPASGMIRDVFTIFAFDSAASSLTGSSVFSTIADQRTSTSFVFSPEHFESIEFDNKVFTDVYKANFSNPFLALYYNHEDGIIAFTDLDDVQWVFDRIE